MNRRAFLGKVMGLTAAVPVAAVVASRAQEDYGVLLTGDSQHPVRVHGGRVTTVGNDVPVLIRSGETVFPREVADRVRSEVLRTINEQTRIGGIRSFIHGGLV